MSRRATSARFDTLIVLGVERRQAAHDTPEEYAKGKQACGLVAYYHALGR